MVSQCMLNVCHQAGAGVGARARAQPSRAVRRLSHIHMGTSCVLCRLCLDCCLVCKVQRRAQGPRCRMASCDSLMQRATLHTLLAAPAGLRCVAAFGGLSKMQQVKELKAGCEVAVATPGRMMDLIRMKACATRHVTYLVLDEADRMFDLGFEQQVSE